MGWRLGRPILRTLRRVAAEELPGQEAAEQLEALEVLANPSV